MLSPKKKRKRTDYENRLPDPAWDQLDAKVIHESDGYRIVRKAREALDQPRRHTFERFVGKDGLGRSVWLPATEDDPQARLWIIETIATLLESQP